MTDKPEPYYVIKVNDELVKEATLLNDSSVYRSATKNGRYRKLEITIPSHLLQQGENTVSFHNENCMVMYDTIVLEKNI
jgi:hypothetical protein